MRHKSFRVRIDSDTPQDTTDRAGDEFEQTAEEIAELTAEETGPTGAAGLEETVSQLEADVERLIQENESARQAAQEEHDRYLRALADFANYKRRREEDQATWTRIANQEIILALLPIIDNFERALQAAQENRNSEALAEGVSLTLRQLQEMLTREGVEPIEAVGREFDPNLHEAIMRVEADDVPDNTVVEELQKGYTLGQRVLRPAQVKVATR